MGLTSDKLQGLKNPKELPEVVKVKTNPNNLFISRDEFIANRRKEKEMQARLEAAKAEIERELEEEGAEELKKSKKSGKGGKKATVKEVEETEIPEVQEEA